MSEAIKRGMKREVFVTVIAWDFSPMGRNWVDVVCSGPGSIKRQLLIHLAFCSALPIPGGLGFMAITDIMKCFLLGW